MTYKQEILASYERLGFNPRDNQLEQIDEIVRAMLDDQIRTVILSAPTGTGKSIIGAVVAETVHKMLQPDMKPGASFLLTATNALAQQYFDTFFESRGCKDPRDTMFRFVKGASNYECSALSTPEEPQTAEVCSIRVFQKAGMESMLEGHCNHCEFFINRGLRERARHLITNYSYYFIDRLSSQLLAPRSVTVFDEAHLLNDLFTDHCTIQFTGQSLIKTANEAGEALKLGDVSLFKHLKLIGKDLAAGKIDDKTYMRYLHLLAECYVEISEAAHNEAERNVRNPTQYVKLSKLSKKYAGRSGTILDLLEKEYPHVFEFKDKNPKTGQGDDEVQVKPIFISDQFKSLENSKHNLLMSATINEQYIRRTMILEPKESVRYIRLKPHFPRENKRVVFFKPLSLNYNTMKDPAVVKQLSAQCYQIVDHHTKQNERGLILAPSFQIVESIADTLRVMKIPNLRIFQHLRGEKLVDWIEAFKSYRGGPAVLLTPSGFEGVDLPGDLSRYQIITKAPFGSLGDRRNRVILDTYPDLYSLQTLMKIVQGAGRSVRSQTDFATTYILDSAAQRLWTAKNNDWKDEHQTSFASVLQGE